jgi:hypothetical protein
MILDLNHNENISSLSPNIHSSNEIQIQNGFEGIVFNPMFFNGIDITSMVNFNHFRAFHETLLPTTQKVFAPSKSLQGKKPMMCPNLKKFLENLHEKNLAS